MTRLLCCHSQTATFLLPNWQDIWNIEVPRNIPAYQAKINTNIKFHVFQARTKDRTLLTGVLVDDSVHLMVTVTKRQSSPFCSTCDSYSCPHYKAFISRQKDDNIPVSNFISSMGNSEDTNLANTSGDANILEENSPEETIVDPEVGEEDIHPRHYLDLPPRGLYNKM